jgi:hypothetical protein
MYALYVCGIYDRGEMERGKLGTIEIDMHMFLVVRRFDWAQTKRQINFVSTNNACPFYKGV